MALVFLQLAKQVSTWRVRWPADELARRGHEVRTLAFGADPAGPIDAGDTVVWHLTPEVLKLGHDPEAVAEMIARCARLVVNLDDNWLALADIQAMDDAARGWRASVIGVCRRAHQVVVATPYLAMVYAPFCPSPPVVVRNAPPRWLGRVRMDRRNFGDRLAWMGRLGVHTADLELLAPTAKWMPPMLFVGGGGEAVELWRSWGGRDAIGTEPTDDERLLYRTMATARAAVIPLRDNDFCRGKSWIKPLEFAAVGVPSVVSRHPAYEELLAAGLPMGMQAQPSMLAHDATRLFHLPLDAPIRRAMVAVPDRLWLETGGGDAWEAALHLEVAAR